MVLLPLHAYAMKFCPPDGVTITSASGVNWQASKEECAYLDKLAEQAKIQEQACYPQLVFGKRLVIHYEKDTPRTGCPKQDGAKIIICDQYDDICGKQIEKAPAHVVGADDAVRTNTTFFPHAFHPTHMVRKVDPNWQDISPHQRFNQMYFNR